MKCLVIFLIITTSLLSHRLNIFSYIEEDTLFINTYFASGAPCKSCQVVVKQDQKILIQGKTDTQGDFSFPTKLNTFEISVDAGSGHQKIAFIKNDINKEKAQEQKEKEEEDSHLNKFLGVFIIFSIFGAFYLLKRRNGN